MRSTYCILICSSRFENAIGRSHTKTLLPSCNLHGQEGIGLSLCQIQGILSVNVVELMLGYLVKGRDPCSVWLVHPSSICIKAKMLLCCVPVEQGVWGLGFGVWGLGFG